jgi:hypothetical protein
MLRAGFGEKSVQLDLGDKSKSFAGAQDGS